MDTITLGNGLQCIFEKRKDTGVVAIQIWVKVGSKYEDPGVAGITHFIEHLIFKGTEKVKANEMAARIEALGGSINAFTSYDNTVYHIVVPTRAFEEGFSLLFDAVMHPAFPEEEILKEKKVVLEEIKMGEDDPQRKLFKELFSLSYKGHPYGRPVIGYAPQVEGMTREDILKYFGLHYNTGNMVVVISGDFDEKKALQFLEAREKSTPVGEKRALDTTGTGPEGAKDTAIIRKDVRESYLAYSYRVPALTHKDIPALEVLETILGDGESSRLQEELKNRQGAVTGISTYLFTPGEGGLFIVFCSYKGTGYQAVIGKVDTEVQRLLSQGISDWEMEKARNMIRASHIYAAETVQGRARQLGNFQTITGDPHFVDKYLKEIDGVTAADVMKVLKTYIAERKRDLVVLLPRETSNPRVTELKNGLKCVVNKSRSAPSFAFRIGFAGGLGEEPAAGNGMFNVLSRMLLKGTREKDAAAIAKEIDLLAGDISPFSGKNIFGLSGKFLSKDRKEAFALLAQLLGSTSLKEEELRRAKEDVLSSIRQRDDDPIRYTFRRFNETLYGGHPYGRDPVGSEADVRNINLKELEEYYRLYVRPQNAVLAISGDVSEAELEELLGALFAAWSGKGSTLVRRPVSVPAAKQVSFQRDIRQAHLIFGFVGPDVLGEDRYAAEVLNAVLSGMSGRVHRVLREENPFAYATTFFNHMGYDGGGMGIYIGTDPKLTKDVEKLVRSEIGKIISDGFTEAEIERARSYLLGNHYISMQSNSAKATSMCLDTIFGLKPGYFKVWPQHIEKVTKDDVDRVARKYLVVDKMVTVSVGDSP